MCKGGSPGGGRTLTGEPAPITRVRQWRTVSPSKDELPDQPPRSRSEIRAREVVGHGEREISHAPGHGQPSRRRGVISLR